MKFIYPSDANSVHIRFQWQQIDKLKIIHAVQFVPYAKSRLAIWIDWLAGLYLQLDECDKKFSSFCYKVLIYSDW